MACCSYLFIDQPGLRKEGLTHCPHATMGEGDGLQFTGESDCGNCSINESKPPACKGYSCLWLAGYGDEEDRPDRSGMLIDTVLGIEGAIECKPLWEGAQDEPAGVRAVERMSAERNQPALVASFPERKMLRVIGRGV